MTTESTLYARIKAILVAAGYADAKITVAPVPWLLQFMRPPFAVIRPGQRINDPDDPDQVEVTFDVTLAAFVPQDQVGEYALTGTDKIDGLLERGAAVALLIDKLLKEDSVPIRSVGASAALPALDPRTNHITWRDYRFRATIAEQ